MKNQIIIEQPFRFGGLMHDYTEDVEYWSERIPEMQNCFKCGKLMKNHRDKEGNIFQKEYPYMTFLDITLNGKRTCYNKVICRKCAYTYGLGVIEMDGETYFNFNDFDEEEYKREISPQYDYGSGVVEMNRTAYFHFNDSDKDSHN